MSRHQRGKMEMIERLEARTLLTLLVGGGLEEAYGASPPWELEAAHGGGAEVMGLVGPMARAALGSGAFGGGRFASAAPEAGNPFASAAGELLGAGTSSVGTVNITTRNPAGAPIVFQQYAGSELTSYTASDLEAKTGSPAVTGEVVTWIDPREDLSYAAAMTVEGLVLFHNTTAFGWTYRNLSTEAPGSPQITGNLTVFVATDRHVNIAGTAAGGDVIRWRQTDVLGSVDYEWEWSNLGDDLRSAGLTVPRFVGRITSFVTPWNAMNVIGLDGGGQIQTVWWDQSLATEGKWTTNNLSMEYGAPAMSGGLTVWQTEWGAINIGGTDLEGKLSVTWWVPNYNDNHWQTSNLTDLIGGPVLDADSVASWAAPWGAMNIAGRESDGTMSVYWWVAGYNEDRWQVAHFRDVMPGATETVGPVTGVLVPVHFTMNILSTSASGDIIRYWWTPTTDVWSEQNISATAVAG